MPRKGIGRPALEIGKLGTVKYTAEADRRITARASTRDASGELRRLQALGSTAAEAHSKLEARAKRLGVDATKVTGHSTFAELAEAWLSEEVARRRILPQTTQMYRVKANRLIREFGGISCGDLRPQRVKELVIRIAEIATKSEYTVLRGLLNQILDFAVLSEVFQSNPYDFIGVVNAPVAKPTRALTPEQVAVFLRTFDDYATAGRRGAHRRQAQLCVRIILGVGGLRISEALAFRIRDVDFETGIVDLNGTLVDPPKVDGQPKVMLFRQDHLKGKDQARLLELSPIGLGITALRSAYGMLSPAHTNPDDPIIRRVEDVPEQPWLHPGIVRWHFNAVCELPQVVASLAETGLTPKDVTPHSLRRAVATAVSRAEGDERAKEMLGHANVRTTQESYIEKQKKHVEAATLDALFAFESTGVSATRFATAATS